MSEKINVLIGANIEGLKTALAESGRSLSDFGTLAQQAPKKAKTAVDQLNQSYRDAVKDAKNLALMQGQTSEAFYEAQLKAKNLRAEIEGLNIVVGQTGKIASGSGGIQQAANKFDMLGHSVNQITRELPAFTQSMTTGFMAISNNIPMLVDQINSLRRANEGLVASGQPVKSVFSQLVGSLFSWQTALSLGITALTVFGARVIELISNNQEAARSLTFLETQTSKFTGSIIKQTGELYKRNEQLRIALGMAQNGTLKDEELIKINNIKIQQAKDLLYENELSKSVQLARFQSGQKAVLLSKFEVEAINNQIKALNDQNAALQANINIEKRLQAIIDAKNNKKNKKGKSFDLPDTPVIVPIEPKFKLPKLKADFKPIKLENFIDTTNAMTGFDRFKMNFLAALDDIEARVGKWSDLLANSLSTAISGAGSAFMSDDKDKWKNYGKMLLGLLGDIAIQIGGALMAMGIPMAAALIPMGFVYIASGAALLLAGGMLKAGSVPSQSNANSGGSQSNNSMSGGGGDIPSFNPTGMMISIDGLVRGNNIVVALDNQTRMNRRVR